MGGRPLDADVIIVGAGPAGGATAISCAQRGLRVILCERATGERDRPGETLHPGIEPLLAQLGLSSQLASVTGARHLGQWIEWGSARRFEPFGSDETGPWRGFQVWRADFDNLFSTRAQDLGVTVLQDCTVKDIDLQTAKASLLTSRGLLCARIIVDSSGSARFLGRKLQIAETVYSPPLFVRYGYVTGTCEQRDDAPLLMGNAEGWSWSARVKQRVYQWTSLKFGSTNGGSVPEELRLLTPLGKSRGADVTWRIYEKLADSNWFIVGDAAASLDPTSSHGVLRAVMTGMMAADLIGHVILETKHAGEAAAIYDNWLRKWFLKDVSQLTEMYRAIRKTELTSQVP